MGPIVTRLLQKSYSQPEIDQRDVQALVWAIASRTKIADMSRQMRWTAARLLTPRDILKVNGGALGLIPERLWEEALDRIPSEVRGVLDAQRRLRDALSNMEADYEELERLAVRFGVAPPGPRSKDIPRGRWSLHPEGFFIRFFPNGYSRTVIEVHLPESLEIERDELQRITAIVDRNGTRFEALYDDTVEPLAVEAGPTLEGFSLQALRLLEPDQGTLIDLPEDPEEMPEDLREERIQSLLLDAELTPEQLVLAEWRHPGWVFAPTAGTERPEVASVGSYPGFAGRHDWLLEHRRWLEDVEDGVRSFRGDGSSVQVSPAESNELMALADLVNVVEGLPGRSADEAPSFEQRALELVRQAWGVSLLRSFEPIEVAAGAPRRPVFDPASDPASGNTSEQSLAPSGRDPDDDPCQAEEAATEAAEKALREAQQRLTEAQDAFDRADSNWRFHCMGKSQGQKWFCIGFGTAVILAQRDLRSTEADVKAAEAGANQARKAYRDCAAAGS